MAAKKILEFFFACLTNIVNNSSKKREKFLSSIVNKKGKLKQLCQKNVMDKEGFIFLSSDFVINDILKSF